jgi:hypothetical protein
MCMLCTNITDLSEMISDCYLLGDFLVRWCSELLWVLLLINSISPTYSITYFMNFIFSGRKLLCLTFGLCYSLSCITKLYNDFYVLLIGRILSGIATSLLFSSFESWMICEHNTVLFFYHLFILLKKNIREILPFPDFLRHLPSLHLGMDSLPLLVCHNSPSLYLNLRASAGLLASVVADKFGYVAPFMASLVFLILGSAVVLSTWTENYGNSTIQISETVTNALFTMKNGAAILKEKYLNIDKFRHENSNAGNGPIVV